MAGKIDQTASSYVLHKILDLYGEIEVFAALARIFQFPKGVALNWDFAIQIRDIAQSMAILC